MALVKKLDAGGSMDLLDEALNSELGTYNLKSKDERRVRDALVKFRDYMATPEGKSFSVDPVANTYTVTGEGSQKFTGSPDEVKTGWLSGKFKIMDDEDANSVAAAIYHSAKKKIQSQPSATTFSIKSKTQVGLGNISDFALNDVYGTEDNFTSAFEQLKDDPSRKAKVYEIAQRNLDAYKAKASENSDIAEYTDLNNLDELQKAIKSQNWDKFLEASYKFKWEPQKFLLNEEQKKQLKIEDDTKAQEASQSNFINTVASRGMSKDVASKFASAGYTNIIDNLPWKLGGKDLTSAFNEYIKSKHGLLLGTSTGSKILVDVNGNPINATGEEFDQFHPLYGSSWANTENGFTPLSYKPAFKDIGNIGKEIVTEGFEPGAQVYGWSKDNSGDYLQRLEVNRNGKKSFYDRLSDGIYQSPISGEKLDLTGKLKNWGKTNIVISNWDLPQELNNIDPEAKYNTMDELNNNIDLVATKLQGSDEINASDKQQFYDVIAHLKYIVKNTNNHQEKVDALKKLSGLNEALKQQNIVLKTGGIIKAQSGIKFNAYLDKYAKSSAIPVENTQISKPKSRDISSLVRGSSNLDKAILATNAGMLAPGWVGIGSGLAATGLEAYKGATDSDGWTWGDTGNLALNLGLSAAAFLGFGGLKGLTKGAKLGKEALEAGKIAKEAEVGKEALSLGKAEKFAGKEVKNSMNELKVFAEQNKIPATVAEIQKAAVNNSAIQGHLGTVLGFTEKIAKSPSFLPKLTMSAERTLGLVDKVGKVAVVGNTAVNLGGAVDATKKILSGNIADLSLEDVNSLTAVAFGGKTATHIGKMKIAKKYGTVPNTTTKDKLIVKVNDEEIPIDDASLIKKFKQFTVLPKSKKANKAELEKAFLDKINAGKKPEDVIKAEQLGKIRFEKATAGDYSLREDYDLDKNLSLQEKGIKWAKKYNIAEPKKVTEIEKSKTSETKPIETKSAEKSAESVKKFGKEINIKNLQRLQTYKRGVKADTKKAIANIKPELKDATKKAKIRQINKAKEEKIKLLKENIKLKSGGVLVLGGGNQVERQEITSSGTKFNHISKPKGYIDFTEPSDVGDIFKGTNYNTIWMPKVEKAFADPKISSQLISRLENYEGHDWEDVRAQLLNKTPEQKLEVAKRLASDNKVGPYHYVINNMIDEISPKTDITLMTPKGISAPVQSISQKPVTLDKSSGILPTTRPGIWDKIKQKLDGTDLSNALMAANTYATNVAMGNDQRKAISDSLYQLPYMQHQYIRVDRPNALLADKNAAQVKSQAKAIGSSVSDIDKAAAIQLEGMTKANDITTQGQTADLKRFDTLRGAQMESNAQVDEYNTGVLGKNRGLASDAFQKIHLVNANQRLAQNTALNNWLLANKQNQTVKDYKLNNKIMYEAMRNPKIKEAVDQYTYMQNEGQNPYKAKYEEAKSRIGNNYPFQSFETSPFYNDWLDQVKNARKAVDALYEPIEKLQLAQQYQQPLIYAKQGTSLTKQDRLELQRDKERSVKDLKQSELVFKSILHNNEMLQRALIKVFK